MPVDVITADTLSKETIKEALDPDFPNVFIDEDGDLGVRDLCICYLLPNAEQRRLRLLTLWHFRNEVGELEKYLCANRINVDYAIVRAAVVGNNLAMTYDVSLEGDGISRRSLVLLIKRFCSAALASAMEYGQGLLS